MAKFVSANPDDVDLWNLIPRLEGVDVTFFSPTQVTVEFTGDPNDNHGHAFRVEIFGTGFEEIDDFVTAGTATSIIFYDETGNVVNTVTGANFDLTEIVMFFRVENTGSLQKFLHSGNDTYIGHSGNDDIFTGLGNDKVKSGGGHDYIKDLGGKDTYDGGAGFDMLSYDEWFWEMAALSNKGIVANLTKGTVKGPDGQTDKIKNIEGIKGTYRKDTLIGDKKGNDFVGLNGKDVIDGKGGTDRVRYDQDDDQGGFLGVTINLGAKFAIDGYGKRDKLKSIEDAVGSDSDDTISGSGVRNWLFGRDGEDTIDGKGGDDSIIGGWGGDTLTGGTGSDQFEYWHQDDSIFGGDTDSITDFELANDRIAFYEDLDGVLAYIGTGAFSGIGPQVRHVVDGLNTLVQMDVDGDSTADMEVTLLDFTGALTESHFDGLFEIL